MIQSTKRGFMKSKIIRYTAGFCLLFLILAAFYFSKFALFIASAFFIIIATVEYRKMFKQKDIHIHPILPEIIGLLIAFEFIFSEDILAHTLITPIMLLGVIFSFVITVIRNKKPYLLTSFASIAAFLLIFCGLYIIKLTYYFEQQNAWHLILVYFTAVLSGDFIASKVGPGFTKKLAPEISPNKTVAGAIANLITTCTIFCSLNYFLDFSILKCIGLGAITSVFSQFGDLTISTFKRDLGIKHSGTMFLEYGGVLDRMDAFIFSAPAAYYYLFITGVI